MQAPGSVYRKDLKNEKITKNKAMLGKLAAASDSCLALLQRNLSFFKSFQAHRTVTRIKPSMFVYR